MITGGGGGSSGTIPAAQQGTLAARPAPSVPGLLYYATDTAQTFVTNAAGNAWQNTGSVQFGTAAGRPAAGATNADTVYYATDTGEATFSNGASWSAIASTSATTFAGTNVTASNAFGFGSLSAGFLALLSTNEIEVGSADLNVETVGRGMRVKEGSNAKQGPTGSMTAGSVTVANTSVTANSRIFVCRGAGGTNPGAWYVSAQTAGTSFVVTSTNAADTGNGVFQIFEPG